MKFMTFHTKSQEEGVVFFIDKEEDTTITKLIQQSLKEDKKDDFSECISDLVESLLEEGLLTDDLWEDYVCHIVPEEVLPDYYIIGLLTGDPSLAKIVHTICEVTKICLPVLENLPSISLKVIEQKTMENIKEGEEEKEFPSFIYQVPTIHDLFAFQHLDGKVYQKKDTYYLETKYILFDHFTCVSLPEDVIYLFDTNAIDKVQEEEKDY